MVNVFPDFSTLNSAASEVNGCHFTAGSRGFTGPVYLGFGTIV